jgi:hypothetical protein
LSIQKAKSAHRQRELELLQAASAAANKPVDELTEQQRQQQAVAVRQWRLQKQREAELATSAKQQAETLKTQAERAKFEEQVNYKHFANFFSKVFSEIVSVLVSAHSCGRDVIGTSSRN